MSMVVCGGLWGGVCWFVVVVGKLCGGRMVVIFSLLAASVVCLGSF